MRIVCQIMQNYEGQEIPSVILSTDSQKYIFNIPQTYQRFIKEHRCKIVKGSNWFFTRVKTSTVGGLFGLMLTSYQSQVAFEIKIFGPPKFTQFIRSLKYKLDTKLLPFSFSDFFTGDNMVGLKKPEMLEKANKDVIFNQKKEQHNKNLRQFILTSQQGNDLQVESELNNSSSLLDKESCFFDDQIQIIPVILGKSDETLDSEINSFISYICVPQQILGQVSKEKIKELKISGQLVAELVQGFEVKLENGLVVQPEDIKEEDLPSPVIFIIDCPSLEHIDVFVKKPQFIEFQDSQINRKDRNVKLIVHLSPLDVLRNKIFQQWIGKFNEQTMQIFPSGIDQTGLFDIGADNFRFKHHTFVDCLYQNFPEYFPKSLNIERNNKEPKQIEPEHTIKIDLQEQEKKEEQMKILNDDVLNEVFPHLQTQVLTRRLYQYTLAPTQNQGYDYMQTPQQKKSGDQIDLKGILDLSPLDYQPLDQDEPLIDQRLTQILKQNNPLIIFLGTGSMKPASFRNVSAIYVYDELKKFGIMLDCGEGTYYQFLTHFSNKRSEFEEKLVHLRIIFITHMHSDHHEGLQNMIIERKNLIKQLKIKHDEIPLFLIIPNLMLPEIELYNQYVEDLGCVVLFNNEFSGEGFKKKEKNKNLSSEKKPKPKEQQGQKHPDHYQIIDDFLKQRTNELEKFEEALKLAQIKIFQAIPVIHCQQAYGITITYQSGLKISYSGDTRPCPNFVYNAQFSDIFIHQATFGDDLVENAKNFMHSTAREAVQCGIFASAKTVILTHFSQRYSKKCQARTHDENEDEDLDLKAIKHYKVNNKEYNSYLEKRVIIAFDHLRFKINQIQQLPSITQLACDLFPDDEN